MKEIKKVVQKLSCGQVSAAGGGSGGGGVQPVKNIKSSPVYRGDLINSLVEIIFAMHHAELL